MGEPTESGTKEIRISAVGMSDMGRVRKNNEDNLVICDLTSGEIRVNPPLKNHPIGKNGTLLMVADGMGGEAAGEVASQIAVATVPKRLYDNLQSVGNVKESNFVLLLREAIEYANQVIYQKAQAGSAHKGMGTTTTAAAIFGPYLFIAQVGDSRAYLVRNKNVVQLTRDQTFLNYLEDIGAEMPADPEKDSRKSILTQAVGSSENVDVKVTYTKARVGDRLLLCSDGLYNMVERENLMKIAADDDPLASKCKALIAKANEGGGTDNITVIMAELSGPGLPAADTAAGIEYKEFREEDFKSRP
ncbi:MAG: PP2C family protein-serine/threonine phosphatase [Deltaproteobacteria bacterium]